MLMIGPNVELNFQSKVSATFQAAGFFTKLTQAFGLGSRSAAHWAAS